jgi:hypothetical protein
MGVAVNCCIASRNSLNSQAFVFSESKKLKNVYSPTPQTIEGRILAKGDPIGTASSKQ